jgi:NAD(P)-dependent dehydrogenase (short-subunit alcohol dehydrogenase family)
MDPLFDVSGRVAVVTGGTRGLGREMVRALAERGAEVVVASRKQDACDEVATATTEQTGRRAVGVACNVSHWQDCDQLVERAYDEFGRVDVLVNNAGMSPLYPSVDQVSEELFDKVIGVNLKGPFRLAAAIGTRMAEAGGGSIINISSVASIRPTPEVLPYAAAKAGLNALTEGLARTLGPTVRVNAIMAGPFLTDVAKAWDLDAFERRAKATMALGRAGQPEEIIGAVLYLASSASSFCTGAVLRLDGGMP